MTEHTPLEALPRTVTRRQALAGAVAIALVPVAGQRGLHAAADPRAETIAAITKGQPVTPGRVRLVMPELAENGNVVAMTVTVESPMTAADHVRAIYVVSEKNPLPDVVRFHLGPRAGRAKVATNIRLATTQTITAIAETSDGRFWSATADVVVTLAACLDSG